MDRRISPRVEWHGPVRFRTEPGETYRIGFLADISTAGAMLWLPTRLSPGKKLEVVMKSDYDPVPVHMQMEVRRLVHEERHGYHGHGCVLETHEPWEHQ